MAERNPPVWMQSGAYQASDDRMITGLLVDRNLGKTGSLVSIEGGVVPGVDQLKTTAPGGNMSFNVSAGICFIPAAGATPPGAYICYNDGSYTGTLLPENSGNPRIDVLVAKVIDQATGGAESAWHFTVLKGTPGVNPVTPGLTTNMIPIAAIKVIPASQQGGVNKITNAQITDLRNFVAAPGGIHLNWGTSPLPAQSPGRMYYDATNKSLYLSDGTRYDPVYTFKEWQSYMAAYRPQARSHNAQVFKQDVDIWDPTPRDNAAPTTAIQPIQVTGFSTPSGLARVSLSVYGRVDTANTRSSMSVRILNGSTSVFDPAASRAVSFYATGWQQGAIHFMATGLPVNTDLTVRLEFARFDSSVGKSFWSNMYMLVEPVL